MPVIPWFNNIDFLVRARFPNANMEGSVLGRGPGHREMVEAARAYRAELEALEPAEVERLVAEHRARVERERPFNHSSAMADFSYWAKMSYWSIDEAVALSLGRTPVFAQWEVIKPLRGESPFAAQYAARREIVVRAEAMGQLGKQTIPSNFIRWAAGMQVPVPEELAEAVRSLGVQVADWKTLYERQVTLTQGAEDRATKANTDYLRAMGEHSAFIDRMRQDHDALFDKMNRALAEKNERIGEILKQIDALQNASPPAPKEPGTRERDSMLRIIIGMAVGGYGYDPTASKSAATKEIAGDVHARGLSIDEDTVRKYLMEARQLL